ncbi:MAG TPA: hypothetical protein DCQ87_01965 [Lachnospiraceae bacterium]|nr:hypothetical protein [Lachnospiraceae bacterium]
MARIEAEWNKADILRLKLKLEALSGKKQKSVMANSINKVARDFRKWEKEDIRKRFAVKKVDSAPIRRASSSKLFAEVVYSIRTEKAGRKTAKAYTTSHFRVRKGTKRTPATVQITKGKRSRIAIAGNKGFVTKDKLADGSIFARSTKHRLPIDITYGPTFRGMAHSPEFYQENLDEAQKDLYEEINKHIEKALAKGK